jgi:tetratricopeptide (TPR) repeat protein
MEASISSIGADEDARSAGVESSSSAILRWLGRREDNWLIIFDGADVGYEVVEGFMPPGKQGNILISSRNATMNRLSSSPSAYMEVIELNEDAAVELFVKSAQLSDLLPAERCHVEGIVRELCCLALAVDQAASSIATGICCIDDYLDVYKRRRLQLMDDDVFKGSSNYGRAVYTTWDISFSELEHRAASPSSNHASYKAAILLLGIFSCFHFDGIREETFRRAAETTDDNGHPLTVDSDSPLSHLLERSESDAWDPFNFRGAIRILTQFSLIHVDGGTIFSMHRLVHQWVQDRLPESSRSNMALLAANVLARSEDYEVSAEGYAHRQALLVHLIPLSVHLKQAGLMDQLSVDTMLRMARVYRVGGKLSDAEALLWQAIHLLQKDSSEVTGQYIDILSELAFILGLLRKSRKAEALERQVLEWREKHLGTNNVLTAVARSNLATTLHDLGELAQAKELKIQVLDWDKERLGMGHPDTYVSMANLACTLHAAGDFREARELQIQVLDWQKQNIGMNHPDTYREMGNLACTLCALGDLSEAKELEIKVLEWRKQHFGMDHPVTFRTMANLAGTLYKLDELAEAKRLAEQVLDWCKAYYGLGHPHTISAMKNLAYYASGKT